MSDLREEVCFDEAIKAGQSEAIREALRSVFNDNSGQPLAQIKTTAVDRVSPLIAAFEESYHSNNPRSQDEISEFICATMDTLEQKSAAEQGPAEDPFAGDFHDAHDCFGQHSNVLAFA